MSIIGLDTKSAMGGVAACLGDIGPGLGSTGPATTYANVPSLGKWILSFIMIIGRLEIFTVFVIFTKSFWKR
ncbi:MAG: hypothetical protein STSR0008_13430 [Ignavibacterium sp.]